ncbi:MAG TPA: S1 family peptidase [Solirubrobacterales bacterium]
MLKKRLGAPIALILLTLVVVYSADAWSGPEAASRYPDRQIALYTEQGISPARAIESLDLQTAVAKAQLTERFVEALGKDYAGAWFEPADATYHVGVTSQSSRDVASRLARQAGIGRVVETPVRSTWAELVDAQERWNEKIESLLASDMAKTGIGASHNAVEVALSSEVPVSRLVRLKQEAATDGVTVLIQTEAPSQFGLDEKATTCEEPFTTKKALCEPTLVAGAGITLNDEEHTLCTAGPMLIKGRETYVLTAGHCFGKNTDEDGSEIEDLTVESEYPSVEGKKEVGQEGKWYENKDRDIAEVKIKRPDSPFVAALPTPVPALLALWVKKAKEPAKIERALVPAEKEEVCHSGARSGEHCGEIGKLNVALGGTEHLVEATACSDKGDSGGPYFRKTPGAGYSVLGTEVGGPGDCIGGSPPYKNYFEPLKDVSTPGYGTLSTFNHRLLTMFNEKRVPRLGKANGEALGKKGFSSKSSSVTFETTAGAKFSCSASTGTGEATGTEAGTTKLTFTGCAGFAGECKTASAAKGEVVLSAKYSLPFIDIGEEKVGFVLELSETSLECLCPSTGVTMEKLKLRGSAIGVATPVNKAVTSPGVFTIAFSQSTGIQSPTKYENEKGEAVTKNLELEGSGGIAFGFTQTGLSGKNELLFEEEAELEAP